MCSVCKRFRREGGKNETTKREHAIINSISKSNKCSKIFALPGNGGTEFLAENLSGDINDFELIKKISLKYKKIINFSHLR